MDLPLQPPLLLLPPRLAGSGLVRVPFVASYNTKMKKKCGRLIIVA
jgi:hypothetical protein